MFFFVGIASVFVVVFLLGRDYVFSVVGIMLLSLWGLCIFVLGIIRCGDYVLLLLW